MKNRLLHSSLLTDRAINIVATTIIVLYLVAYTFLHETNHGLLTAIQISVGVFFIIISCLVLMKKKMYKEDLLANDILRLIVGFFIVVVCIAFIIF
jgi:hypothetical protein